MKLYALIKKHYFVTFCRLILKCTLSESHTGLVENFVQPQWDSNLRAPPTELLGQNDSLFCRLLPIISNGNASSVI